MANTSNFLRNPNQNLLGGKRLNRLLTLTIDFRKRKESFDGRVVDIEVKSASAIDAKDSQGLMALKEIAGERFYRGVIQYTGQDAFAFAKDMFLLPISALWELRES